MVQLRVRRSLLSIHPHLISSRPFHAAVGIMTTRMLINLRKFTAVDMQNLGSTFGADEGEEEGQIDSHTQVDGVSDVALPGPDATEIETRTRTSISLV